MFARMPVNYRRTKRGPLLPMLSRARILGRHTQLLAVCVAVLNSTSAGAIQYGPVNVSGAIGYNFRYLDGSTNQQTLSNHAVGSLYANTYLWRPWLATTDAGATIALDHSTVKDDDPANGSGELATNSAITTGNINLNVLPQSRTPLSMRFAVTDTRVDNTQIDNDAFVVLQDADARSYKVGVRQSLIHDQGHRAVVTYDNNRWTSGRNGVYQDQLAAATGDILLEKQRVSINAKYQESSRSKSAENNKSSLLDAVHYLHVGEAWRFDTRGNYFHNEREFNVPSFNRQSGTGITDISQFSIFSFYRPPLGRLSTSGGIRVYDFAGENDGQLNEAKSFTATAGSFFQFNKQWRVDASTAFTTLDSNNVERDITRLHGGVLYQSDIRQVKGFSVNWFGSTGLDRIDDTGDTVDTFSGSVGHNWQRAWYQEDRSRFSLSFNQSLTESYFSENKDSQHRIENTGAVGWDRVGKTVSSYARMILSDRRAFGDQAGDEQLVNLQANQSWHLSRRSSVSGNITLQRVFQDFGDYDDRSVTSATSRISYQNKAIFNVPRLSFSTAIFAAHADQAEGEERYEWDNRLDYLIGRLIAGVTYRTVRYDELDYHLLFFQAQRQF